MKKNFIGGLFREQKGAELALQALKENGFEDTSLNLLECTHENKAVVLEKNPSGQSIAIAAAIGAFLVGGLGAIFGLLTGLGVIPVPGPEAAEGGTIPVTGQLIASSIMSGILLGGVTGVILGVASRLVMARYRKVDTSHGIQQGDFMVAVQTDDIRRETKAKLTMKEYGAVKFDEFRDTWDTEVWSVFDETRAAETNV